ncbi:hypothetical protein E2C01_029214 [Portunus trituberculatus]|uniref:Uncharacterized protein n=1 Tax=Portunus trituberculatus TaxID=210409 RepID=A0A5B7EMG1_PORTR|nr:hypothetical protein [Portunus trituberculatus]
MFLTGLRHCLQLLAAPEAQQQDQWGNQEAQHHLCDCIQRGLPEGSDSRCGTAEHDGCLPQPVRDKSAWTSFSAHKSGVAVPGHHLVGSSSPSPARLRKHKAIITKLTRQEQASPQFIPLDHSTSSQKTCDLAMSTLFQVRARDSCSGGLSRWAWRRADRMLWSSSEPSFRRKTVICQGNNQIFNTYNTSRLTAYACT